MGCARTRNTCTADHSTPCGRHAHPPHQRPPHVDDAGRHRRLSVPPRWSGSERSSRRPRGSIKTVLPTTHQQAETARKLKVEVVRNGGEQSAGRAASTTLRGGGLRKPLL